MIGNITAYNFLKQDAKHKERRNFADIGEGSYIYSDWYNLSNSEVMKYVVKISLLPVEELHWYSDSAYDKRDIISTDDMRKAYGDDSILCRGIKIDVTRTDFGTVSHVINFKSLPEIQGGPYNPHSNMAFVFGRNSDKNVIALCGECRPCTPSWLAQEGDEMYELCRKTVNTLIDNFVNAF